MTRITNWLWNGTKRRMSGVLQGQGRRRHLHQLTLICGHYQDTLEEEGHKLLPVRGCTMAREQHT